jgi:hypothetical protein
MVENIAQGLSERCGGMLNRLSANSHTFKIQGAF